MNGNYSKTLPTEADKPTTQRTHGQWQVEWTGTDDLGRQTFAIDTGDRQFNHDLLRGESVAREVAALPDLLAVVEHFVALGRGYNRADLGRLNVQARAALAKARGESAVDRTTSMDATYSIPDLVAALERISKAEPGGEAVTP